MINFSLSKLWSRMFCTKSSRNKTENINEIKNENPITTVKEPEAQNVIKNINEDVKESVVENTNENIEETPVAQEDISVAVKEIQDVNEVQDIKEAENVEEKTVVVQTNPVQEPELKGLEAKATIARVMMNYERNPIPLKTPSGTVINKEYAEKVYKKIVNRYMSYNNSERFALCDAYDKNPEIAKDLEFLFDSTKNPHSTKDFNHFTYHLNYHQALKVANSALCNPTEFKKIMDLVSKAKSFNKTTIWYVPKLIETMKKNPANTNIVFEKMNNIVENSSDAYIFFPSMIPIIEHYQDYKDEIDKRLVPQSEPDGESTKNNFYKTMLEIASYIEIQENEKKEMV